MKALYLAVITVILTLYAPYAQASTYLEGQVTARGEAYTNTNCNVYLSCSGSNWSYTNDWAYIRSDGTYRMDTSSYYSPCGSYYSGTTFSSCEVYAYPAWNESDTTLAASDRYSVTIDCNSTASKDISLNIKDKTIAVSVTAGGNAVTSGLTVYCSQRESPWTYSNTSGNTGGVYSIPVTAGNYFCSAYCSDYSSCVYAGNPSTTVSVSASDTTKSAALSFSVKDKTIAVSVSAGNTAITSDVTVNCYQRESPWTSSSTSTATDGVYNVAVTAGNYSCSAYCNNWSTCAYSGYPSTNVSVGSSDTTVAASVRFTVKDKTLRVAITAGGTPVTSNVSVYASEQGGGWSYSSASSPSSNNTFDLAVGAGKYYVSAYCSNWSSCDVAGYPNATVDVEEDDSTIDMTLAFLRNDSTISGVVTDGSSSIANVGVSIYSYRVEGSSGVAWSVAPGVSKAVISSGSNGSTMVSIWANTDSSGAFQARVPAGTYTISVWPPWNRRDLGQASIEAVTSANATTSVSIVLPKKTAEITGRIADANGNAIARAYISGWSYSGSNGSNDWFWSETDSEGSYTVYAIEGLKYNVSAYFWSGSMNNTICNYNNEGIQSVVGSSAQQTVNFTFPICDCAMTISAVDANSNIISSIYGGVNASPVSLSSGQMWYGMWGNISGGSGSMKVQSDIEYRFTPYTWSSDYVQGDEATATCSGGAGAVSLSFLPLDATISGSYVDSDGAAISLDQYSYIYLYATKGNAYRSCTASSSDYSCQVSAGRWCIGYWVDPSSGYASVSSGSSTTCFEVAGGGSESHDITLLKIGTIAVAVQNSDGSARASAWVEATPYSNSDRGKNDYQHMYMSSGCMTSADGTCTISAGAASGAGTDYYLNAYVPYYLKSSENIMSPDEVKVTVIADESTSAVLSFQKPDGTSVITVTEGSASADVALGRSVSKQVTSDEAAASSIAQATVDCFSTDGGSFEVETDDNGVATCPCATQIPWKGVAYNIVANNLWMSDVMDITCLAEGGAGALTMNNVATVPEGKSVTITDAATEPLTIELSDGFSVFFPAGSLDTSGQVTCNVDITVTPFTANRRPASFYGYICNCQDEDGQAIVQLNSNASFTVPVNQGQVENVGLTMASIEMCYHDDSTGSYAPITTATIDDVIDTITYQQNHLTTFAVVGNGNLAGITGEDAGDGSNEHTEEEGGGAEAGAEASGAGGCGCRFGGAAPLAEKIAATAAFVALLGVYIAARRKASGELDREDRD